VAGVTASPAATRAKGELPFTGLDQWGLALMGYTALLGGFLLHGFGRRKARRSSTDAAAAK